MLIVVYIPPMKIVKNNTCKLTKLLQYLCNTFIVLLQYLYNIPLQYLCPQGP